MSNSSETGRALYLVNTETSQTILVTRRFDQPNEPAYWVYYDGQPMTALLSRDAEFVYFTASATGMIASQSRAGWQVPFVFDRRAGTVRSLADANHNSHKYRLLWLDESGRHVRFQVERLGFGSDGSPLGNEWLSNDIDSTSAHIVTNASGTHWLSCRRYQSPQKADHAEWRVTEFGTGQLAIVNPAPAGSIARGTCPFAGWLNADGSVVIGNDWENVRVNGLDSLRQHVFRWVVGGGPGEKLSYPTTAISNLEPTDARFVDANVTGSKILFTASFYGDFGSGSERPYSSLFLRDLASGRIDLVSRDVVSASRLGNGYAGQFSGDGRYVYFLSSDRLTDLHDFNRFDDLFAYRISDGSLSMLSRRRADTRSAGNGSSDHPMLSRNGQWLAFNSAADNLFPGMRPHTSMSQVILASVGEGNLELISHRINQPDVAADGDSELIGLSDDGRYVAFQSSARDLGFTPAPNASRPVAETYVFDRHASKLILVTRKPGSNGLEGVQAPKSLALDASGSWILHQTDRAERLIPDLVYTNPDRRPQQLMLLPVDPDGETILVSQAHAGPKVAANAAVQHVAHDPQMRTIVFATNASNLNATPFFASALHLYAFDRVNGRTVWLTRASTLTTPNVSHKRMATPISQVSSNAQFIAFSSDEPNLNAAPITGNPRPHCYRYSLRDNKLELASPITPVDSYGSTCKGISDDGRFILFRRTLWSQNRIGYEYSLWLRDMETGEVKLIHPTPLNAQSAISIDNAHLSADGQSVVFESDDPSLIPDSRYGQHRNLYLQQVGSGLTTPLTLGEVPDTSVFGEHLGDWSASANHEVVAFSDSVRRVLPSMPNYASYQQIFTSRAARISDNPGLSGLWGEPSVEGQGFHLIALPGRSELLLSWYTYLPGSGGSSRTGHRWLLGLGRVQNGVGTFTLTAAVDGVFDAQAAGPQQTLGQLQLRFRNCWQAEASYAITLDGEYRAGSIPLQRISPDTACSSFEQIGQAAIANLPRPANTRWQYGMVGAWHDTNKPGQGMLFEVMPQSEQVIATWFTFDSGQVLSNGRQPPLWLAAIGSIEANRARLTVYETSGGRFDQAGGDSLRAVGSLNLDAVDCNQVVAHFSLTMGGSTRSGQIPLSRITPAISCDRN